MTKFYHILPHKPEVQTTLNTTSFRPSSRPCYGDTGFTRNSDTDFGKDKLFKTFNGTKTSKIIFSVLFDTDFGKDKPHKQPSQHKAAINTKNLAHDLIWESKIKNKDQEPALRAQGAQAF